MARDVEPTARAHIIHGRGPRQPRCFLLYPFVSQRIGLGSLPTHISLLCCCVGKLLALTSRPALLRIFARQQPLSRLDRVLLLKALSRAISCWAVAGVPRVRPGWGRLNRTLN